MHQIPEINLSSLIDHELVRPWLCLSLALLCFCPIFYLFALFSLCFSLLFLFPVLALILALEFLLFEPFIFFEVTSAILGPKLGFLAQCLRKILISSDHDEEEKSNVSYAKGGKGHNLKEEQVSLDLDSMEIPCLYESTTDDDDEKMKEKSTVVEQSQLIKNEDGEPWFNDVLTFWKRMEKGELAKALGMEELDVR